MGKNSYKLVYGIKENDNVLVKGSLSGIPAESDSELVNITAQREAGAKLAYENKEGNIMVSASNIPTKADTVVISREDLESKKIIEKLEFKTTTVSTSVNVPVETVVTIKNIGEDAYEGPIFWNTRGNNLERALTFKNVTVDGKSVHAKEAIQKDGDDFVSYDCEFNADVDKFLGYHIYEGINIQPGKSIVLKAEAESSQARNFSIMVLTDNCNAYPYGIEVVE